MKLSLSNDTTRLLNNLKDYCQSRFEISAGNSIIVNSSEQSCIICASIKEHFDREVRIPSLQNFVRIIQTFNQCELELFDQYMNIYNSHGSMKYVYAPKSIGDKSPKIADLSDAEWIATLELTPDTWKIIQKFSTYPDMQSLIFDFSSKQYEVLLGNTEKTSQNTYTYQSSNVFKLNIDIDVDSFAKGKVFFIDISRLKLLDCQTPYKVSILYRKKRNKYILQFSNIYADNCTIEYTYSFEVL